MRAGPAMTHKPSIKAWVERPSFSIISSDAAAGRRARSERAARQALSAGSLVADKRSMIVVCCYLVLFVAVVRCVAACAVSKVGTARLTTCTIRSTAAADDFTAVSRGEVCVERADSNARQEQGELGA